MISKTNIWETALLYSDGGIVSQTVRSGNGPYKEKYHARPALLTIFFITQSGHSIPQMSIQTELEKSKASDSEIDINSIRL